MVLERPAQGEPHQEVRRAWLPPVGVERHDVGTLQPGDELRFGLGPADEVCAIGQRGAEDLHRNLGQEPTTHGIGRELTGGDRHLQLTDLLARFQAEVRR